MGNHRASIGGLMHITLFYKHPCPDPIGQVLQMLNTTSDISIIRTNRQTNKDTSRVFYMDALKCFAIFLVLAGHCIQHLLSSEYADEPGYRLIYSFHMPLFMMIVGFFFAKGLKKGFFRMVAKKSRQLLLPILAWSVITVPGKQILVGFPSLQSFVENWIYGLWFLKSAFVCCLLGYFSFSYGNKVVAVGGVLITLCISQLIYIPTLQLAYMYPCFVAGGLLMRIDLDSRFQYVIMWTSLVIFLTTLMFLDSSIYTESTGTFNSEFEGTIFHMEALRFYRIIMGISGSLFFILLFKNLLHGVKKSAFRTLVGKIGQYTMAIYIMQSVILEWFMAKHLNFDNVNPFVFNLIIVPVISLLIMLGCYAVAALIDRNRYLSLLLLGKKLK